MPTIQTGRDLRRAFACSRPRRGAIAVVRIWGPRAVEIASAVFRPERGATLAETAPGKPRFGRVGTPPGDEVVAVVTSDLSPEVEIHCHGGPAAVELVVSALVATGAEWRGPAAWVRQNARSTIEAEARVDLARAPTLRTAEILLEQAQGALAREFDRVAAHDTSATPTAAGALLARAAIGLRLISGWSVVLSGRPNVGKSRLFNALAGYERAIVDPTPGTTRDVVTVRTALDGWPVELADTAGLRSVPQDEIEAIGIALARARHAQADLAILVLDRSEPLTEPDREHIEHASGSLIVANKCDLPFAWDAERIPALTISAETGAGIDQLVQAIVQRLVPDPPPAGAGVPFRPRHERWLRERTSTAQG